ncbi:hypothetical protein [Pseudoduganella aquatica]|uniref:Uncharacterized protein n=1 Tax=Pseudoduganella aquatica TaxID=2660641 RepID=A0A7X4KQI5_9BURK|nr:hypothetical protein [Pseudoduganella aquatica]MYN11398.1 hypothetical protein [Pseudoduganella aquatica]
MRAFRFKQTLFLIVITLLYLCFELGFNARLLDVVGGNATPDDVDHIEFYGRSLSGIAAALVLLQLMLRRRTPQGGGPSRLKIALCCAATALVVYGAIKTLVDVMVATRDAEFRRTAYNSMLLQRSLVNGRLTLDGLVEDQNLFAQPEGKAFLALFPFLAVSVEQLDDRIKGVKDQLIDAAIRKEGNGTQGYYDSYTKVMKEFHGNWQKYARIPTASDEGLLREQDKAWNDYLRTLSRHGWTPSTVPANRRGTVQAKVRKSVPVPPDWDPSDEATFRDAVEQRYRKAMSGTARAVTVGGERIPPGLSYPEFIARAGVQRELRTQLHLPPGAQVAASYGSPREFSRLYEQMVGQEVRVRRAIYDAPAARFEQGGSAYRDGDKAARAVIVPPVALFFSLLGAIGHFSKLLYLVATLLFLLRSGPDGQLSRRAALGAFGVLLLAFSGVWSSLALADNRVTRSELFQLMIGWARAPAAGDSGWQQAGKGALANIAHVVAVGQGHGYPVNEAIRTHLLNGMDYGYQPQDK